MKMPDIKDPSESRYQQNLVLWAAETAKRIPELGLLFSIPNGGYRNLKTASLMKKEGLKPGVPDLFLAVPRGNYCGFFIEMKKAGGRLSETQKKWITELRKQGYAAACFHNDVSAREAILKYLNLDKHSQP